MKFGQKEHIKRFMKKGEMKFSPVSGFRLLKEKERGDDLEGAVSILNDEFVKLELESPTLGKHTFYPVPGSLGRMAHFVGNPINSFSTYALTDILIGEKEIFYVDEKMRAFGDYVLVIPNKSMKEYFRRVRMALDALNLRYQYGYVNYKDLTIRGDMEIDLFTKGLNFSHQSEHRIIIATENDKPLFISIGSLEDICFMAPVDSWIQTEFKIIRKFSG